MIDDYAELVKVEILLLKLFKDMNEKSYQTQCGRLVALLN